MTSSPIVTDPGVIAALREPVEEMAMSPDHLARTAFDLGYVPAGIQEVMDFWAARHNADRLAVIRAENRAHPERALRNWEVAVMLGIDEVTRASEMIRNLPRCPARTPWTGLPGYPPASEWPSS